MMTIPFFKAKDRDSDKWVEGFYCEFPLTNDKTVPQSCLFTYQPDNTMGGIVNKPVCCSIDMTTLEFIRFIEIPCKTPTTIITK